MQRLPVLAKRNRQRVSGKFLDAGRNLALLVMLLGVAFSALLLSGTAQAASVANEGPCPAARRGVNLALPAVVRIATTFQAQLTYYNLDGSSLQFPLDGGSYHITTTGSGAFLSAAGDVLTAFHVVSVNPNDQGTLLAERAAPDIAQALNSANPSQRVTSADVLNSLLTNPSIWQGNYGQSQTLVYLSSQYTGSTTVGSLQDLQAYPATVTAQSSPDQPVNNDLAILHVSGVQDMPTVALGDSDQVYQGDSLTVLGYPGAADLASSDGTIVPNNFITASLGQVTVSALKTTVDGSRVIQVDGDLEQGESGGPVLNADGQVVGVVSFSASDAGDAGQVGFLRTINDAKPLLRQAGVDTAAGGFEKKWAAAYDACASNAAGHWHDALNQYKQLARQYPNFKGVQPYLVYTGAQAAHETLTTSHQGVVIGVVVAVLVVVLLVSSFLLVRRRRRAQARARTFVGFGPGVNQTP